MSVEKKDWKEDRAGLRANAFEVKVPDEVECPECGITTWIEHEFPNGKRYYSCVDCDFEFVKTISSGVPNLFSVVR